MTRSWWENEEIIARFRGWLSETDDELDALDAAAAEIAVPETDASDSAIAESPDSVAEAPEADSPDADTPGTDTPDTVVFEFVPRDTASPEISSPDTASPDVADTSAPAHHPTPAESEQHQPAEPLPEVGLLQLVESFTALRHELKLQTKSSRGLEEATHSAVQGLEAARRQFQSAQAREQEAAERSAFPLIEALAGLDESLLRGARAFRATHQQMTQSAPERLRQTLDEHFQSQPWWRRWFSAGWHRQARQLCGDAFARTNEQEFASLMEGFALIQTRLGRTLQQHEIERIACVGQPVDPGRMAVVELVDDPAAAPETVVEEVRPGYVWRGRVVRFAEVRAVRSQAAAESFDRESEQPPDMESEKMSPDDEPIPAANQAWTES